VYGSVVRNHSGTRGRRSRGDSWLARLERRLLVVFGPAQLGRIGQPRVRSQNRTEGVTGGWELRRDSTGRTYLVPVQSPGTPAPQAD